MVTKQDKVDFFWLLGDIGYADDALLHTPFKFRYEEVYNGYMTWMQPLSAYQAFQVRHPTRLSPPVVVIFINEFTRRPSGRFVVISRLNPRCRGVHLPGSAWQP